MPVTTRIITCLGSGIQKYTFICHWHPWRGHAQTQVTISAILPEDQWFPHINIINNTSRLDSKIGVKLPIFSASSVSGNEKNRPIEPSPTNLSWMYQQQWSLYYQPTQGTKIFSGNHVGNMCIEAEPPPMWWPLTERGIKISPSPPKKTKNTN